MHFRRFYDSRLAQASYLIGCQRSGEALVVDPTRDVDHYVNAATREGLHVTHVTETHMHADFVSGARELAQRTGATLLLSREGGRECQYAYAAQERAHLLADGEQFMVGDIRIDVLHTPGHTPEHLSFLVTDAPARAGPWGILTGDFVLVGDVGRPDLLERAAGMHGTMEAGAHALFRSLERFRALPDHLQVWPGHGAGSACGKAIGAVASSTVGYEKLTNWALATTDESEFVRLVLQGQPDPPRYFKEMKRMNRDGPRIIGHRPPPERLPASVLYDLLQRGVLVVDTRTVTEFAAGHVPGMLNIPLGDGFTKWAGWLLPYDRDVYLVAEDARTVSEPLRDLAAIGLDRVAGVLGTDAIRAWTRSGHALQRIPQATPRESAAMLARGARLIDVRDRTEWQAGHVPDARNISLGHLPDLVGELPSDRPLILQCQSGRRSIIGAGLLQARGFRNVVNVNGGFAEWQAAGLAVVHETALGRSQAVALARSQTRSTTDMLPSVERASAPWPRPA
jgi:hydroxyacylglutathione hydrolase